MQEINSKKYRHFYVQVKDNNGCKGSDTAVITTLLPLPAHFLTAATSLCSYSDIIITPNTSYYSYLWSSGSTAPSITITKPGTYWLEATISTNCDGRDSIVVALKDCMERLYVP